MSSGVARLLIRLAIVRAGTISAPILTKTPDYPVYLTGEAVTLDCTVDDPRHHNQFTFFQNNANHLSQRSSTYHIHSLQEMATGKYTCQYTDGIFTTPMSNSIILYVIDRPLAPKIFLRPSLNTGSGERWYIQGETVTVICTSPELNMKGVQYYINGEVIHTANATGREATYQMLISSRKLSVTCMYWRMELGRQIESLMSDPVTLKIMDYPPSPSISRRPSHSVYTMDEPIIVMCTPPQSYTVKGIRYYKEEKEIYVTNAPQTSYRVPRNASGNYTCGYWIEIEGRQILSYLSQNINVRRIVPASGFSTSLNPAQFVESDISQSSACSTPAGPLIATLTTSGVLPPSFTAPSTSRTTARLQSTPGTQSTATSQAPSTFRTTSHPQSTTGTQSSASPKGDITIPLWSYGIGGGLILILICVVILLRTHACCRVDKQ
ncbi:uncharacterized protein LOC121400927 [Xenopus laevis]|uniref:Uncharacterized protein LOC121400927 n=1 Tax=Xenopus laevis TaxID=8355 RepID=A0A8J1MGH0_XENLA|nr:uncharacterized protein LOC121400927 [Xenopus laevis]